MSGEIVGVIGPNGAGKTTLFNVICGFVRPTRARSAISGKPLRRHQPHDLAKLGIARTLQGVGLVGRTLDPRERDGRRARRRRKADFASAAVRAAGGRAARSRPPQQGARPPRASCTSPSTPAAIPPTLPYGIQKRASLARALMAEPTAPPARRAGQRPVGRRHGRARAATCGPSGHAWACCWSSTTWTWSCRPATGWSSSTSGGSSPSGPPAEVQANPEVTTAYLGQDVSASRSQATERCPCLRSSDLSVSYGAVKALDGRVLQRPAESR